MEEKLELRVELLLQRLKIDALALAKKYRKDFENVEFQRDLIVLIGASTREISRMVIRVYEKSRIDLLTLLVNTSCRVGPKMGNSRIRGGESRSQTSEGISSVHTKQAEWIESRLNYRRFVLKMLKEIESFCEDVICLTQNVLKLSQEQFRAICASEEIDRVIEDSSVKL